MSTQRPTKAKRSGRPTLCSCASTATVLLCIRSAPVRQSAFLRQQQTSTLRPPTSLSGSSSDSASFLAFCDSGNRDRGPGPGIAVSRSLVWRAVGGHIQVEQQRPSCLNSAWHPSIVLTGATTAMPISQARPIQSSAGTLAERPAAPELLRLAAAAFSCFAFSCTGLGMRCMQSRVTRWAGRRAAAALLCPGLLKWCNIAWERLQPSPDATQPSPAPSPSSPSPAHCGNQTVGPEREGLQKLPCLLACWCSRCQGPLV